jgi:hypothetical protein
VKSSVWVHQASIWAIFIYKGRRSAKPVSDVSEVSHGQIEPQVACRTLLLPENYCQDNDGYENP